jgi:hypothetical protein
MDGKNCHNPAALRAAKQHFQPASQLGDGAPRLLRSSPQACDIALSHCWKKVSVLRPSDARGHSRGGTIRAAAQQS